MKIHISEEKCRQAVCIFLGICIAAGVMLHIVLYYFDRSLWLDEAMLASSLLTRTPRSLVSEPLDWGQSSPIGYLYIVKCITLIFGQSEAALRVWSLIMGFGSILLVYLLLKNLVQKHYALLFTAFFSLTDRYIYYANECKPYMSDNFFCLLTLYLWQRYREKKVPFWQLILCYSIFIWFSFTAVFFVAACMILLCIELFKELIWEKSKKAAADFCACGLVLVSFLCNYVFWLSRSSENAGEAAYWDWLKFPMIPRSFFDMGLIAKMVKQFLAFLPSAIGIVFCIFFVLYLLMSVKYGDKSHLVLPFLLSLFLLLAASFFGFYPMIDRLVQPYCIPLYVFAAFACDKIETSFFQELSSPKDAQKWCLYFLYGILFLCFVRVGKDGCKNLTAAHVYQNGSEVKKNMEYLKLNMTEEDMVYVYRNSIPVYTYMDGYKVSYQELKKLPLIKDSVIYGRDLVKNLYLEPYGYNTVVKKKAVQKEAKLILNYDSVYIFTTHGEAGIISLFDLLKEYGTVELVSNDYATNLYQFVKTK